MKNQQLKKQPSELELANNQIHILQTTNQELRDKLETNRLTIERKDRMFTEELARSQKLNVALSQVRTELASLKGKWYVRLLGRG